MLITNSGVIIRFHSKNISQTGRATQGVRLMRLEEGGKVSTLAKIEPQEETEEVELSSEETDDSKTETLEQNETGGTTEE